MLTKDEQALVERCLETYPAGIPEQAWGYGPMASRSSLGEYYEVTAFSREMLAQYG